MGLFGGVIGEIIIFFNTLKSIGYENVVSIKKLEKNVFNCLNLLLKNGAIEFGIDEKIVPELPKLDETLNFENILTMQIDKMNELKELLLQNIGSLILQKIIDESLNLGFDEVLTKEIIELFFKFAFEQDSGNFIKICSILKKDFFV